ncbi:MAG: hypothetical protein L0Y66_08530 [Myxococcaceae bacterium]|nr:hypothetical protein [Myxococcaceae bacterium]MCI0672802.1 hypothetical protein [Myxococcaceae bacterium]
MLLLGFSSGLPIYLVGNTLGFWMRKNGIELGTIGFLSWVGLAYSLKFLWAPLVDKTDAPLFGRWLGRRRGWMLVSQLAVIAGLFGMAMVQPQVGTTLIAGIAVEQLTVFGVLALIVAFASATQDIVVDAWRIESAESGEQLGLLTSSSALGYRSALLVTDALILLLAAQAGWVISYEVMALLVGIGVLAVLLAREPAPSLEAATHQPVLWTPRGLFDAIVGPFVAFFRTHRRNALLMLAAISIYRLADFVMGPMANPFYVDLGLSETVVGSVRGSVGLIASLVGIVAAGLVAARSGVMAALIVGALLGPGSNLAFAWLAHVGPDPTAFGAAMAIDNIANAFAGTALITYMSSLTNAGYTATQYALLSSFYALLGKVLKGLSGVAVEYLGTGRSLLEAYSLFFVATALIGIPALLLCMLLAARGSAAHPDVVAVPAQKPSA